MLARWAADLDLRGVCVQHFLLGQPLVAALRDTGLSVTTGTVNQAAIAERALAHALTRSPPTARTNGRRSWPSGALLAAGSVFSSVPRIRAGTRSRPRPPAQTGVGPRARIDDRGSTPKPV
jgi:hypothetical protein